MKDVISVELPAPETLRAEITSSLAKMREGPAKASLRLFLTEAAATGATVLDVARSMTVELNWPEAITQEMRDVMRAQVRHEMTRHLERAAAAQEQALFVFLSKVMNSVIPAATKAIVYRAAPRR